MRAILALRECQSTLEARMHAAGLDHPDHYVVVYDPSCPPTHGKGRMIRDHDRLLRLGRYLEARYDGSDGPIVQALNGHQPITKTVPLHIVFEDNGGGPGVICCCTACGRLFRPTHQWGERQKTCGNRLCQQERARQRRARAKGE